jgi:hypothetical protein
MKGDDYKKKANAIEKLRSNDWRKKELIISNAHFVNQLIRYTTLKDKVMVYMGLVIVVG